MSSQNLANAIENMNTTRIVATGNRLRLKGGERLYFESWSGSTSLGGFAHVDPRHEAGKLIQRITKWTLRATEAWTDGRHAEDDKYVELDSELVVTLASATEGAAMSTALKVTQAERSHGFVARQALFDCCALKTSNDPHTRDTQKMQGRRGIEGEAHCMVNESG